MKGRMKRFEMKETNCPIIDGLYNFAPISAGKLTSHFVAIVNNENKHLNKLDLY